MLKTIKTALTVIGFFLLAGCVTTTTDEFSKEKDLSKAEQTYIQIAYAHINRGNLIEARRPLDKALSLNKRSAGAYLGWGLVYSLEKEIELAHENFKKAIRFDETQESRYQYGVFLYNIGDYKGAYREFKKVTADTRYQRRAVSFDFLGLSAARIERKSEAIEYFERAITLNRQLSGPYINLAQLHRTNQDFQKAYSAYNGYARLVRLELARHSAGTLWLGIQLAHEVGDEDTEASLALKLRNVYPESRELQAYQEWKQAQN